MMVQEYKLVSATTPEVLTNKVNEMLEQGWKLHGPTDVAAAGSNATYFVQPVVREIEQPGAWG